MLKSVTFEIVTGFFNTFDYNLEIKNYSTKYSKES